MEGLDWNVLGGFILSGGAFAAVLKLLPIFLDYLKTRRSGQSTLTEAAFKASGMTLESLVAVIDKLEKMVDKLEERIAKMRDEYDEDIAILRKRYEEELTLLVERHKERSEELLDEIKTLKTELRKYKTLEVAAEA